MTLARVRAVALFGVDAHPVDVEATTISGPLGIHLDGLPTVVGAEVRDRVRAAILNSAHDLPTGRTTVRLLPISLPKRGSGFDLPIAVAILAAAEAVPADACTDMVMIGELGLDGEIRSVPGVLPAVLSAADAGADTVVVPYANAAEASLARGMKVIAVGTLAELVARLRGRIPAASPTPRRPRTPRAASAQPGGPSVPHARADLTGMDVGARTALEISAAGGHSIALVGSPTSGTRLLAERLPMLLPDLDPQAALEVTAVHSVAGMLRPDRPLITRPPFYAPYPTISRAALVGGSGTPGVMSLAHRGVLFLDHATEIAMGALEMLPTPMDSGEIRFVRAAASAHFPSRFTLVLAVDSCSCRASTPQQCVCTPIERWRHGARLPGRLLERIEIKHRLGEPIQDQLRQSLHSTETNQVVADRVQEARDRARRRLAGLPWRTNAEIPRFELHSRFALPRDALTPIDRPMADGRLSARGADRVIRTAWTLTDLAGSDQPTAEEVRTAFHLWDGPTGKPRETT